MTYEFIFEFMYMKNIVKSYLVQAKDQMETLFRADFPAIEA